MIEIQHQKQNLPTSCTSACLAMILGKTSEEVEVEFHTKYHEEYACPFEYLKSHGCKVRIHSSNESELDHGKLYLVTVPSLNLVATLHHIVIDFRGESLKVYDPNVGLEERKVYVFKNETELEPHEVNLKGFVIDASIIHAPWLGINIED